MKNIVAAVKGWVNPVNNPKSRILLVLLLGAMAVFVFLMIISYRSFQGYNADLDKLTSAQRVINAAETVQSSLLALESDNRAYTSVNAEQAIFQIVSQQLDTLRMLLKNDAYQVGSLDQLQQAANARHYVVAKALRRKKAVPSDAGYVEKVKATSRDILEFEALKMEGFRERMANRHRNSFYLNIASVGLAILFGATSLFIFFRDREERKRVESNLTELNLNKDKFFSIISHDLRGPTSNIVRLSEFLLEPGMGDPDRKTMTLHLHKSAQNLQKLLENLLSWAKFQMGRLDFTPTPVDLYTVVNESITQVTTMAADKAIMLKNQVSPRTYAYADDQMLMMVLRNLLVNAIKFTNQAGTVKISATETPQTVDVSVADTGIGMTPDTIAKLFLLGNHFTTLGTSNEKGSGLGLILSMELLEKNNGTIRVSSEPGKGSTFTFTLPKIGN